RRGRRPYITRNSVSLPKRIEPPLSHNIGSTFGVSDNIGPLHSPVSSNQDSQDGFQATKPSAGPQAFVAKESFMSPLAPLHAHAVSESVDLMRDSFSKELLQAVGATSLPPNSQIEAYGDSYFNHHYHRAPIIDRADLSTDQPSLILTQAICLIGSILRYSGIHSPVEESEPYYNKVKALLYANHEPDQRNVLKALCILALRNITPPKVVSLDCSWQWIGTATRLAQQMGFHREETYAQLPNPGNARRIMWFLFTEDKLVTACFGRPSLFGDFDFNIRPLRLEDFEIPDLQAELCIEYTNLNVILGRIVDRHSRKSDISQEEVLISTPRASQYSNTIQATSFLQSLQDWIHNLPLKLQIYTGRSRNVFRRDIHEVHINYFVCLIVFFRLFGHAISPQTASTASLVASSCIARLYQEITHRDEINYLLPINNWFLMVGCAPQICHNTACQGKDRLCGEELLILTNSLRYMKLKWPPAGVLLDIVGRLCSVEAGVSDDIGDGQDWQTAESWSGQLSFDILEALFPFPSELSPRMGLVKGGGDELGDQEMLDRMVEAGNDDLDWIFNEFQLGFLDS
ncbi:hypothetical protein N7448_004762, partial [Penicillium atrosanguineum]